MVEESIKLTVNNRENKEGMDIIFDNGIEFKSNAQNSSDFIKFNFDKGMEISLGSELEGEDYTYKSTIIQNHGFFSNYIYEESISTKPVLNNDPKITIASSIETDGKKLASAVFPIIISILTKKPNSTFNPVPSIVTP